MAEAILRHLGGARVRAASAGEGGAFQELHPLALQCLRAHQVPTAGLHNKIWGEFFGISRPTVRVLITLGEVYASKAAWPPGTLLVGWPILDPALGPVDRDIDLRVAFEECYERLYLRIQDLLAHLHELDSAGNKPSSPEADRV